MTTLVLIHSYHTFVHFSVSNITTIRAWLREHRKKYLATVCVKVKTYIIIFVKIFSIYIVYTIQYIFYKNMYNMYLKFFMHDNIFRLYVFTLKCVRRNRSYFYIHVCNSENNDFIIKILSCSKTLAV